MRPPTCPSGSRHERWNAVAAELYDRVVARGQDALYAALAAELLRLAPATGEILDVGCGPGHAALAIAGARPGLRVVGVDLASRMVEIATARARREGAAGVTFRVADALALPFEDGRFDAACSFASIKHWPDRARGLAELHRVLKPGAPCVLVEADRGAPAAVIEGYARRWPWLPPLALRVAFRGFVAKTSLDLDEARRLLDRSPFRGGEVAPWEDTPLLVMRARKAG